jgi:hypothetical protein
MTVLLNPSQFHPVARELTTGIRVDRAAATLPQSTDVALFTITGGRVLLVGLVGEVTVAIGAGVTPEATLVFNPTATGADQNLCAPLNIASDAVGELYTISGTVGDAMRSDLLIGNAILQNALLLAEGDIELLMDESVAGQIAWSIIYVPWDTAAEVVAA